MIVLDASVLIAHLDNRGRHHQSARQLLEQSESEPLGASTISLAETLVAPARAGRLQEAETALERLGVAPLECRGQAAGRLARLRAETGRKLPDCCVLLVAEEQGGVVASFDDALLKAAHKMGLPTLGGRG